MLIFDANVGNERCVKLSYSVNLLLDSVKFIKEKEDRMCFIIDLLTK